MITNLRIQNVALINEVEVDFAPGLNVLSGETGAGKSIVVDSINFLLGGRVSRELIRAGADFASVQGVMEFDGSFFSFVKEGLFELGIETEDAQIMLSRVMQADTGKSVCKINGRTVTVSVLKSAAQLLVDLHGQHEHQSLLDPIKQLTMLDQFCGAELSEDKKILEGLLSRYRELNRELKKLTSTASAEQIEIWRFQLDEIEKAALKPDEEDALTAKRNRLAGVEKLSRNTASVVGLLYSGFFENRPGQLSAVDQTAKAAALSAEIAKLDPDRENLHSALVDIHTQLAEITRDFRDYMDELDADPQELDKAETRLDTIYRLKKKYGGTVETILKKQEELTKNLDGVENSEAEIARVTAKRKELTKEITSVCGKMNALRTSRAQEISAQITEILRELGMQNAEFFMEISKKTSFTPDGNDEIEFMFLPNPGEPAKPLRRIASGGEMSRIMLAIKTILTDKISTVIFDEVDTGISGRTAQQVAEKLLTVSRTRQILCITHLPQIAAMADTHFLIQKSVHQGEEARTVTTVSPLSHDDAINELARLTGGAQITDATLQAAREMKMQADGMK
ncbi:MAG: DNA repair protein RecN [Defluviitaleaceae bacterium]|nr:DNA repair protein RecN [Defluviitaleaceae bacterium]MCL2263065.1 DNA repair protein RecN [Defluviitaleaceae bacterium]